MSNWGWKGKDGKAGGLLYEPGNWGDLLKHLWVLRVAQWMLRVGPGPFAYVDPFAGAPIYPLGKTVRHRLRDFHDPDFFCALRPYLQEDHWPSAATLVADELADTDAPLAAVYDQDDARRTALSESGRFRMLPLANGWEVLRDPPPSGLLMIDPYDLLAEWEEQLPGILQAVAGGATVLLYLYNRAGRGAAQFRSYRKFRNALGDLCTDQQACIGRAPADAFLPNSFHEMILIPAQDVASHQRFDVLVQELRDVTQQVVEVMQATAVFEKI